MKILHHATFGGHWNLGLDLDLDESQQARPPKFASPAARSVRDHVSAGKAGRVQVQRGRAGKGAVPGPPQFPDSGSVILRTGLLFTFSSGTTVAVEFVRPDQLVAVRCVWILRQRTVLRRGPGGQEKKRARRDEKKPEYHFAPLSLVSIAARFCFRNGRCGE